VLSVEAAVTDLAVEEEEMMLPLANAPKEAKAKKEAGAPQGDSIEDAKKE